MVYDSDRLENALQALRDTEEYKTKKELSLASLQGNIPPTYELRPNKNNHRGRVVIKRGLWDSLDEDDDIVSRRRPRKRATPKKRKSPQKAEDKAGTRKRAKKSQSKSGLIDSSPLPFLGLSAALGGAASENDDSAFLADFMDFDFDQPQTSANTRATGFPRNSDHDHEYAQSCVECFTIGIRCSLVDDFLAHPCKHCTDQGKACERKTPLPDYLDTMFDWNNVVGDTLPSIPNFESHNSQITDSHITASTTEQAEHVFNSEPSQNVEVSLETRNEANRSGHAENLVNSEVSSATLKTIQTSFSHPIQFGENPTESLSCHFCADHRYGMVGCDKVEVMVWAYPGGVLEEVGGGNRERGCEQTRMCPVCIFDRLHMGKCSHGIFSPICYDEFADVQALYISSWDIPHAMVAECSVCQNAGFYACNQVQTENKWGEAPNEGEKEGCGLILCSECFHDRAQTLTGSLGEIGTLAKRDRLLRADFEFLLPGSLMHQAIQMWI